MQPTVLIVEDDRSLGVLFSKRLSYAGYNVERAYNGMEGLQMAEALRPDVILLDYQMPIMDGTEMLQRLRASAWGRDLKVALVTAANLHKISSLELADIVLQKPVTTAELLDVVGDFALPQSIRA